MCPANLDQQTRQQRELEFIEVALDLLDDIGLAELTMDRVAAHGRFSKGTLYSHFCSKEDLVVGIGNYALALMIKRFKGLLEEGGTSRQRFMSLALAYLIQALDKPRLFRTALCSKSPAVLEKASADRKAKCHALESQVMVMVSRLIEEAIGQGELTPPENMNREQLCFSCWSSGFGFLLMFNADLERLYGVHGPNLLQGFWSATSTFLDGLAWQPLSRQQDSQAQARQIIKQHFSSEAEALASSGRPLLI